jgi:hypothetical protein
MTILIVGPIAAGVLALLPIPQADAGLRGCVSLREVTQIRVGMPRHRVHRIFGTTGRRDYVRRRDTGHIIDGRSYRKCQGGDNGGDYLFLRFRDGRYYDDYGAVF